MELKEKNSIVVKTKAILTATKAGTRKFDKNSKMIALGEIIKVIETENIICNEGLLLAAGFFIDESGVYDVGLTYCEIGTDNTAPVAGDAALGATHHRNTITNDSRALYVDTFVTFFTAGESTATIEEAGIWGGSGAGAGNASGLMFAHWLASFDNSLGAYDITITYVLTIARG